MAGLVERQMAAEESIPVPPDTEMVATPEGDRGPAAETDESDPAFVDAMKFAMTALYENGGAKNIAKAISSADDKTQAVADTAYKITEIVDERTQGNVPEELLMVLAMRVLEEVSDICEAAGYGCKPAEIAEAFKRMVLRFVQDQGYDTAELQAAMDSIDPAEIERAAQSAAPTDDAEEEIPA